MPGNNLLLSVKGVKLPGSDLAFTLVIKKCQQHILDYKRKLSVLRVVVNWSSHDKANENNQRQQMIHYRC